MITVLGLGTASVSPSGPCAQRVHATQGHAVALLVFRQTAHPDRPLLRAGLASLVGTTSFCHPSLSESGWLSHHGPSLGGLDIMCSVWRRRPQFLPRNS